jgi:phosphatidylserine/phosphatidylglycerophosphate/cardiolipin synthase-like enzyme
MIIDGATVLTGSFNFTTAAEDKNAENLLVVRDKKIAKKYRANWNTHFKHSDPYPAGGRIGEYLLDTIAVDIIPAEGR